jgi:hypothetical protein
VIAQRREEMNLEQQLREAFPDLGDDSFGYHATDLQVLYRLDVWEWLRKNYKFFTNITVFKGSGPWENKIGIDIPFAGNW